MWVSTHPWLLVAIPKYTKTLKYKLLSLIVVFCVFCCLLSYFTTYHTSFSQSYLTTFTIKPEAEMMKQMTFFVLVFVLEILSIMFVMYSKSFKFYVMSILFSINMRRVQPETLRRTVIFLCKISSLKIRPPKAPSWAPFSCVATRKNYKSKIQTLENPTK